MAATSVFCPTALACRMARVRKIVRSFLRVVRSAGATITVGCGRAGLQRLGTTSISAVAETFTAGPARLTLRASSGCMRLAKATAASRSAIIAIVSAAASASIISTTIATRSSRLAGMTGLEGGKRLLYVRMKPLKSHSQSSKMSTRVIVNYNFPRAFFPSIPILFPLHALVFLLRGQSKSKMNQKQQSASRAEYAASAESRYRAVQTRYQRH